MRPPRRTLTTPLSPRGVALATLVVAACALTSCKAKFADGFTKCAAIEPFCPEGFQCGDDLVCHLIEDTDADPGTGGNRGITTGTGGSKPGSGGNTAATGGMSAGSGGLPGSGGVTPPATGGTTTTDARPQDAAVDTPAPTPASGGAAPIAPDAGRDVVSGGDTPGAIDAASCSAAETYCPPAFTDPGMCVPKGTDCRTATLCGTSAGACASTSEALDCTANPPTCKTHGARCSPNLLNALTPLARRECVQCIFRKCCVPYLACRDMNACTIGTAIAQAPPPVVACRTSFCARECASVTNW